MRDTGAGGNRSLTAVMAANGERALITNPTNPGRALSGTTGTHVVPAGLKASAVLALRCYAAAGGAFWRDMIRHTAPNIT